MAQILEREDKSVIFDRAFAMKPTPRVERLRETFLNLKPTASIERARIETRAMKDTPGEPTITRRAKVFAAVVREMPIDIYPDELLVGCTSVRPRCANITPMSVLPRESARSSVLGGTGTGQAGMADLDDDEKRELQEELAPFWREQGRTAHGHYGHNIHALEKVLKKGFLGIRKDAENRLRGLDMIRA